MSKIMHIHMNTHYAKWPPGVMVQICITPADESRWSCFQVPNTYSCEYALFSFNVQL